MMIIAFELNNGNRIFINPEHITDICTITDEAGGTNEHARIYFANGHRAFIDVSEPPEIIAEKIKNVELYAAKFIFGSEMRNLQHEVRMIANEIKRK